jgi:hypothetical protein
MDKMRRGVGYLRRSTDRQEQSIEDQRGAITRYAAEAGWSNGRPTPYGFVRVIVSADGTRRAVTNGHASAKGKVRLRRVEFNPEHEWIVKDEAFPGIVSKELWCVAQAKRQERAGAYRHRWKGRATARSRKEVSSD